MTNLFYMIQFQSRNKMNKGLLFTLQHLFSTCH
jgi:hypothetical protein